LISAANQEFSKFHQKLIAENRILRDSESAEAARILNTVKRVANRVIDASGYRDKVNWEVIVVKAKEANAMVLPNGKIIIFTGLLPVAANDAGLAAIIGHEIAHVVASHAAERIGQAMLADVGLKVIDKVLENRNSKNRPAVNSALGLGIQYGLLLPFSRDHELEADRIGMQFMAKAGYDPAEAAKVWERMQKRGGGSPWEFLSTHPSNATRQAKLQEFEPEARRILADRTKPIVVQGPTQLNRPAENARFDPIAFQPTLRNGFWYKTKFQGDTNPITFTVAATPGCTGGACTQIVGENGLIVNLNAGLSTISTETARKSWTKYDPALRQVKFPLNVGDNWVDDVEIKYSTGEAERAKFQFTTTAYESVRVIDTEFMAFRISVLKNGVKFRVGWYAPETGTFVKVEFYKGDKVISQLELVDYQKGIDMSGGLAANISP
jgi:hypothetical protein